MMATRLVVFAFTTILVMAAGARYVLPNRTAAHLWVAVMGALLAVLWLTPLMRGRLWWRILNACLWVWLAWESAVEWRSLP